MEPPRLKERFEGILRLLSFVVVLVGGPRILVAQQNGGGTPLKLLILEGNGLCADPGLSATPLLVSVNTGAQSTPVTFAVTSGNALVSGTGEPDASATVEAQTGNGGQSTAQVKITLSRVPVASSVIEISTGTGGSRSSVSTTIITAGVKAEAASGDSVHLTWAIPPVQPSNQPTTIEAIVGDTIRTLGVADKGVSAATITNLVPGQAVRFRVVRGGVYTGGTNEFSMSTSVTGGPSGGYQTGPLTLGERVTPPVVCYPAIDTSGGHLGGEKGEKTWDFKSIASGDDNRMACIYTTESKSNIVSLPWANGRNMPPYDLHIPRRSEAFVYGEEPCLISGTNVWTLVGSPSVSPDGTIYGTIAISPRWDKPLGDNSVAACPYARPVESCFGFQYGSSGLSEIADGNTHSFTLPTFPPASSPDAPFVGSCVFGCVSNGYFGAICDSNGTIDSVVWLDGKMVGRWDLHDFWPIGMSESGCAIGSACASNPSSWSIPNVFMDGSGNLITTGPNDYLGGRVNTSSLNIEGGVNNQGQVIGYDVSTGEAFIWQKGVGHVPIRSLIPGDYRSEISSIVPALISNADRNGTIHIVIRATFADPSYSDSLETNKSEQIFTLSGPCSWLNSEKWTIQRAQFPDRMRLSWVQCINSNGILAGATETNAEGSEERK